MVKKLPVLIACCFAAAGLYAQQPAPPKLNRFVDVTATGGSAEGSFSAAYGHNWRLGKSRKFEIGTGARLTSYLGTKKDFITAPARLARSVTFPFIIVFAGQETQNFDTLTVQRPLVFSANITLNLGYHLSSRLYGGINIDVAGFSAGRTSSAILHSNGTTTTEPAAKPAAFNLLLTGDNDLGSLNSEFFAKYNINKRLAARAVYQFLFAEYKTTTLAQTAPDGTENTRFRNKVNAFGLGLSYNL